MKGNNITKSDNNFTSLEPVNGELIGYFINKRLWLDTYLYFIIEDVRNY